MKTPTEVALERVAKAVEQMTRTMNDFTKVLEKQNQILLSAFQAVPTYRDVEVTQTIENNDQTVKEVMDSLSSGQKSVINHLIGSKD